jgi:hypothetical protein
MGDDCGYLIFEVTEGANSSSSNQIFLVQQPVKIEIKPVESDRDKTSFWSGRERLRKKPTVNGRLGEVSIVVVVLPAQRHVR